jgi:hypothetical protein
VRWGRVSKTEELDQLLVRFIFNRPLASQPAKIAVHWPEQEVHYALMVEL